MNESYYQATVVSPESTHPSPPAPQSRALGGKEQVLAVLMLICSILCIDFSLFGGFNAGYTISTFLNVVLYFLFAGKAKHTLYGYLCIGTALLGSLVFTLYNDELLLFGIFCLNLLLLAAAISERYVVRRHSTGSFRCIVDLLYILFACPVRYIGQALCSFFSKNGNEKKNSGVLAGLICSLPVLLIVTPLLIRADKAFADMFSFFSAENFWRLIGAAILGSVLFIFYFSHAFGMRRSLFTRKPVAREQKRALPSAALVAFLSGISILYLLYLISQVTYFFSAFWGKLPDDFLPAAYARRGFFEMCVISAINLVVVFFVILLSRRKQGKVPGGPATLCAFISLFSLLLIATALAKMILYIDCFGLTRLRILTTAFMIFLAIVFLTLLLRLLITRLPYMRIIVLSAALICIALGFMDIDATIARYNVCAYQSGALSSIDMRALDSLSPSALPHVATLIDDEDQAVSERAKKILKEYADTVCGYKDDGPNKTLKSFEFDIRDFNYSEYVAHKTVEQYYSQISYL